MSAQDVWAKAVTSRVGRHICGHFARYSHPADLPGQFDPAALRSPHWAPHPVSMELREPIYEAGRRWVAQMREQTAVCGKLTEESRTEVWQTLLVAAEAEVDAIRARHQLEHKPLMPGPARVTPPPNRRPVTIDSTARAAGDFRSSTVVRPPPDDDGLRRSVRTLIAQNFPAGDVAKVLGIPVADVERLAA